MALIEVGAASLLTGMLYGLLGGMLTTLGRFLAAKRHSTPRFPVTRLMRITIRILQVILVGGGIFVLVAIVWLMYLVIRMGGWPAYMSFTPLRARDYLLGATLLAPLLIGSIGAWCLAVFFFERAAARSVER